MTERIHAWGIYAGGEKRNFNKDKDYWCIDPYLVLNDSAPML